MADREIRVLLLGDSASLQSSLVKAEAATATFETRLKNAVVVSGEAGAMSDGLARKMSAMNTLGLSPSTVGLIGLAGAAGLAIKAGKSMVENAELNEKAQGNLEQAFKTQGLSLEDNQKTIEDFLYSNAKYIDDQYAAKDAIAAFTRAGFDQGTVTRLMNDSLDLAALKNISLTEASKTLLLALQGNTRGLKDLGFSAQEVAAIFRAAPNSLKDEAKAQNEVEKATDAQSVAIQKLTDWEAIHHDRSKLTIADKIAERDLNQKVADAAAALTEANNHLATAQNGVVTSGDAQRDLLGRLEPKIKDGRQATSDLEQSNRELKASWDKLSNEAGPKVIGILVVATTWAGNFLAALGDAKKWAGISSYLANLAVQIQAAIGATPRGRQSGAPGMGGPGLAANNPGGPWGGYNEGNSYYAFGSPSTPGANNDENDPRGRTQNVNIQIDAMGQDSDQIAREIARQLHQLYG